MAQQKKRPAAAVTRQPGGDSNCYVINYLGDRYWVQRGAAMVMPCINIAR